VASNRTRRGNCNGPGAVASKPDGASPYGVSPYGAFDIASNVFEWAADWYDAYSGNNLKVTGFGQIYEVIRGGFDAHAGDAETRHRAVLPPRMHSGWAGFRCARDVVSSRTASTAQKTPVAQ
jgi:formylglycine-generating enzyme required for sulfatase activity